MVDQSTATGGINFLLPNESFRSVLLQLLWCAEGRSADTDALKAAKHIGNGSGFVYRVDGKHFLVTAGHVMSGRHWETNEFLLKHPVGPTHLRIGFRESPGQDGKYAGADHQIHQFAVPVVDDEEQPVWLEHPQYGHGMDVAVLLLDNLPEIETRFGVHVLPWEPPAAEDSAKQIWVAEDVFIVGYPYGLSSGFSLPLWVRGTIASEPALKYVHRKKALPVFLVDARTREGQSGAPVMLYQHPGSLIRRGDGTARIAGTGYSRLLGVYSGRTSDVSDLGFVWRIEEIPAICRDGVRADPRTWVNQLADEEEEEEEEEDDADTDATGG